MPHRAIAGLPETQADQSTELQKRTFLEAFNSVYESERYKDDEGFSAMLDRDIAALFAARHDQHATGLKRRR